MEKDQLNQYNTLDLQYKSLTIELKTIKNENQLLKNQHEKIQQTLIEKNSLLSSEKHEEELLLNEIKQLKYQIKHLKESKQSLEDDLVIAIKDKETLLLKQDVIAIENHHIKTNEQVNKYKTQSQKNQIDRLHKNTKDYVDQINQLQILLTKEKEKNIEILNNKNDEINSLQISLDGLNNKQHVKLKELQLKSSNQLLKQQQLHTDNINSLNDTISSLKLELSQNKKNYNLKLKNLSLDLSKQNNILNDQLLLLQNDVQKN